MQVIYAFIAMLLVALLSLTLQRGIHSTERRQIVNEVTTQLVGVGIDILEHIGRHPFDYEVDTTRPDTADWIDDFPYVTSPLELTPTDASEFGAGADFDSCDDIDDFSGKSTSTTRDGIDYAVDISVTYVNENWPDSTSATQTYAKEVLLAITSTSLYLGTPASPMTVEISRVFTYDQPTIP